MTPSRQVPPCPRPVLAPSLPRHPLSPLRREEKSRDDKSRVLESAFELRPDRVLVTATGEILLAALQP